MTKITNFNARATLFDAALFYQDDWKVNRKFTFDYGLRFEGQNRIHDHADWGPRIGFAYALDGGNKRPPKTVIRAGYGWFFNRFSNASVIQAIHQNGINQQQIVYSIRNLYAGKAAFREHRTGYPLGNLQHQPEGEGGAGYAGRGRR